MNDPSTGQGVPASPGPARPATTVAAGASAQVRGPAIELASGGQSSKKERSTRPTRHKDVHIAAGGLPDLGAGGLIVDLQASSQGGRGPGARASSFVLLVWG